LNTISLDCYYGIHGEICENIKSKVGMLLWSTSGPKEHSTKVLETLL